MYAQWGVPKEGSLHYMSIRPELTKGLGSIIAPYAHMTFNYNFLKLTPGCSLMWHFDTYATFVRYNNIAEDNVHNVCRTVIMMKETEIMVEELHVFYGGGGHVGSIENDVNIGLDVIIGLEFALARTPIAFAFDAKPGLDLASLAKGRENFLLSGGGFTLRYTFQ